MGKLVLKNEHQEDVFYNEIGLHAQIKDTILNLVVNTIGRTLQSSIFFFIKKIFFFFTLTSYTPLHLNSNFDACNNNFHDSLLLAV